jgi:hypothetical protein
MVRDVNNVSWALVPPSLSFPSHHLALVVVVVVPLVVPFGIVVRAWGVLMLSSLYSPGAPQ